MRIFLTGGTGFIGSAIITELVGAGHQVLALARSKGAAVALEASGAEPHQGSLRELESLARGAAMSDAAIHAAFDHDFSKFAENCEVDSRAIETIGEALAGSKRPFVVTAGLPLTPGPTTEVDVAAATGSPRVSEQTAMALVGRGVHASVLRMSQAHDANRQGLASYMLALAREKEVSAYVGEGQNGWSAVHRLDAASLYRLAVEGGATGAKYQAVSESHVSVRDVAEAIGQRLGVPVVSLSPAAAAAHFGWLEFPVSMDTSATSVQTQVELGWRPRQLTQFLANLRGLRAES